MFGLFHVVQSKPTHRVEEIGAAIKQVLVRLSVPFKCAAFDMAMQAPHLSRGLNAHGISVTRLAMLPENVRAEVWKALAPFFGVPMAQIDDEVVKRLEREIAEERREREDIARRLADLSEIVRKLVPSTEEEQERSCA